MIFQTYLNRFFIHPASKKGTLPFAEVYIIIPVYAEEQLENTLLSLQSCFPVESNITIIWVINTRLNDEEKYQKQALENLELLKKWPPLPGFLTSMVLDCRNLESKNAGVGLARKIGMDMVIFNLKNQNHNPWLVCLDGDCLVSPNYFQEIEKHLLNGKFEVATFEFSHFISAETPSRLKEGIVQYELFLEYYRMGLYQAGFPWYFHTVGSSMACKATAYAKSGGMNQRKAGEDFYFLHKLFPHFQTIEIKGPLVFPSPRISERVPFGTGRFQKKWMESMSKEWPTYHPEIFILLKSYLNLAFSFLSSDQISPDFEPIIKLNPMMESWLGTNNALQNLNDCKGASPTISGRRKAFYRYFDGFQVLKMVHFFQPHFPEISVEKACEQLLPELKNLPSITEKVHFVRRFLTQSPFLD